MPYGETIIFQSRMKDIIIRNLRDCGCGDAEVRECWDAFLASVADLAATLRQAKKSGSYSGLPAALGPFLDLVQNLRAIDLSMYAKNLSLVLKAKDVNGAERAAHDLLKLCERYLEAPPEE